MVIHTRYDQTILSIMQQNVWGTFGTPCKITYVRKHFEYYHRAKGSLFNFFINEIFSEFIYLCVGIEFINSILTLQY